MNPTTKVLLVALAAGTVGAVAGLLMHGFGPSLGPLLRSEPGQRVLQGVLDATAQAPPADLPVAERGQPIPGIRLPALDGVPVALSADYAGRPLLINLWASWCGPCIEEMPELDRFADSQDADGVQVIGIALDSEQAVRDFLRRVPVDYPILLDSPGPRDAGVQLGNLKGVLPYTVLVDADGRLVKQKVGPFQPGEIDGWVE